MELTLDQRTGIQMPSNYVVMDENEMQYLDGGACVSRAVAAFAIDTAILATPFAMLGAACAPLKFAGRAAAKALIAKYAPTMVGAMKTIATMVCGGVCGFALSMSYSSFLNLLYDNAGCFTSVGGIFALALDRIVDGKVDGKIKW